MKQQISFAVLLLISSSQGRTTLTHPPTLHWNEDRTTIPDPLSGKPYLTSTSLRYLQQGKSQLDTEVFDIHPDFFVPYNRFAPLPEEKEPLFVQQEELKQTKQQFKDSQSNSDSSSDSEDSEEWSNYSSVQQALSKNLKKNFVQWSQAPDLGELDFNVVGREKDIKNGKKFSGWTNPLSWTDNGEDDGVVLVQIKNGKIYERKISEQTMLAYAESEGPTKVDLGDSDYAVVYREKDIANGKKASGWTNPLGWTDDGTDDDTVLFQMKNGELVQVKIQNDENFLQYAESEGPTKVDLGDSDYVVVYREKDIANGKKFSGWTNPLGWTDDGTNDETVLLQNKQKINYEESGYDTPADNGEGDEKIVNFVQLSDEEEDSDDKPLTSEDLVRTAEQINIDQHVEADLGQDDDSVL